MKTTFLVLFVYISSLFFFPSCQSPQSDAVVNVRDTTTGAPAVTYQKPLVITKGGAYTGNYRSTDSKVPAVWIQTTEPVEITGCIIASAGPMIKCNGGTKATIHHNSLYGIMPDHNNQWGRALDDYQPQYLVFENNYIEHSGGLLIDHTDSLSKSVVIRYNLIRNTDKKKVNLAAGDNRAGILFNSVANIAGEISWNQFENLPDSSNVEDNINIFNSGGSTGAPYLIHDNYIKGAYPYPLNAPSYVGSGITIDGDPGANTMEKMSQFINVYNNQVLSTCNACMNLAAGHDIHFYSNTMISSGMYPNGTASDRFWGGCCIWNASNVPAKYFINNTIKGNKIGYVRKGMNVPFPDRQDWVVVPESPISVKAGDNTSLPNPITLETEKAEWPKWQAKLAGNKITIGNGGSDSRAPAKAVSSSK